MSEALHSTGPRRPTWTHMALAVSNVDATVGWYEAFTHLRVLARHEDKDGRRSALDQLLVHIVRSMPRLSELIGRDYFSHAEARRPADL